ncbi:MAG: ATP-binding protein [Verrucomicrobia bacterium]|nr:ATP-binding protein [Verrucomicrobiota bacterium]
MPRELVILSGKGGTGKTTVAAALAGLSAPVVLADADVDAANLYLLLDPEIRRREPFFGGYKARIRPGHCTACGKCEELCRFDAVFFDGPGNGRVPRTFRIEETRCEGCGVCVHFCPEEAIDFRRENTGESYVSSTRFGPMAHARLIPGSENSGKLVTHVREKARELAQAERLDWIYIDGPPGIGCPAIAAVTGADAALVVAEPTVSGQHDMQRIAALIDHFQIPCFLCVNKWDLNPALADALEQEARSLGMRPSGRVRYDAAVVEAMMRKQTVPERARAGAGEDLRRLHSALRQALAEIANPQTQT